MKAYMMLWRSTVYYFRNFNINFNNFQIGENSDLFEILNGIKKSALNGNTAVHTSTLTKIEQIIRLNGFYEKKGKVNESFVELAVKLQSHVFLDLNKATK